MILLILTIVILLPDCYIWFNFINGSRLVWCVLYWIPTALTLISMSFTYHYSLDSPWAKIFVLLFLAFTLPKVFFVIISLIAKGIGLLIPAAVVPINILGVILSLFLMVILVSGHFYGWKHLVVTRQTICFRNLPQNFNGYKIVQLSDFHIGTYRDAPEVVSEIVDKVNSLDADLIVFTGDLINSAPEEVEPFVEVLSKMKAKDGVVSIMGNHDYCMYRHYDHPRKRIDAVKKLQAIEREMGWKVLLNENILIRRGDDSIAVIGVENYGKGFVKKADIPKASEGLNGGEFTIMLSHDPTHWRKEVIPMTNAALTLSGHTHAMQLKIFGFSPSKWMYDEWGGKYQDADGCKLYVSTGVGSNIPFRVGAWPEINLITLEKGEAPN